ncbi:DUF6641 family protein [Pseudocolwellia agarivorans]|uniref:DUF6641 family protein n=1 Tax=Pseudocolwellia agarivorans TaxID=1911682 RepID=UPI0009851697|nr:DUF6641 family protein [Pseudocolwellia agarivorans]
MTKANPLQVLSFIAKPKVEAINPIEVKRNKLITRLNEQRAMVKCLLDNTDFVAYKEVFITDDESGEKRKVKRPKRVRPWFYQSTGKYYFEIKYGTKSLEIQKNKPTIDVGNKGELLTVIDTIIDATKQGFLDTELAKVKGPTKTTKS